MFLDFYPILTQVQLCSQANALPRGERDRSTEEKVSLPARRTKVNKDKHKIMCRFVLMMVGGGGGGGMIGPRRPRGGVFKSDF